MAFVDLCGAASQFTCTRSPSAGYDGFCSAAITETSAARTRGTELTDAEPGACSGIASGNASCGGKHFGGVTVGCICGSKHLDGVIGGDNGGGNGGGNGDSARGNGDLMLWPFLAATGCASATSFLNRPVLLFKSFLQSALAQPQDEHASNARRGMVVILQVIMLTMALHAV